MSFAENRSLRLYHRKQLLLSCTAEPSLTCPCLTAYLQQPQQQRLVLHLVLHLVRQVLPPHLQCPAGVSPGCPTPAAQHTHT